METATDLVVEHARYQLRVAQVQLREAEAELYCCEDRKKAAISHVRKQVKRWEVWLADHEILAAEDEA